MVRLSQALFNSLNKGLVTPDFKELPNLLKTIEKKWYKKLMLKWSKENASIGRKGRYILSMFPYPSGRLHLGHVRIYTSGDILARYSRMLGRNKTYKEEFDSIIHPMGFDSFGLPAENAAMERNLNPMEWTNSNIRTMKKQLDDLSLQFNWREATSNAKYYKWTQEIFLRLMDSNLVYKSYAKVNWDPIDKTVLADEQVDEEGRSWRSGALVEKRYCRQWFIKVNAFTKDIYDASDVEPSSWRDVLAIQRSWIGKPNGWLFYIPISEGLDVDLLPIFTSKPELFLRKDTTLVLAKDHWFEKVHNISKKGFIKNPFTQTILKVILTDSLELPSGCNATLITPSEAECEKIYYSSIDRETVLINAKLNGFGAYRTSDKYRDWLVSRQRFWGTPIPVVKCGNCGYKPVPRSDLPVELPKIEKFDHSQSANTVANYNKDNFSIPTSLEKFAPSSWINTTCPNCQSSKNVSRECDTLDTLFDSSWYFLRYATEALDDKPFDKSRVKPVWCYIGGLEHASMHLFYARFITHFLHSRGDLPFKEPFEKLLVQGVVKSKTYSLNGRYLSAKELDAIDNKSELEVSYQKMSKSKGNGVDPEELLANYGIDATRFCLMSYANPRTERLWRSNQEEFKDVLLFIRRVILTVQEYVDIGLHLTNEQNKPKLRELDQSELESLKSLLIDTQSKCNTKAIHYLQEAHQFRQYISVLHVLLNTIRNNLKTSIVLTKEFSEMLANLIIMLNPIMPHLSEELWYHFGTCRINPLLHDNSSKFDMILFACDQPWPLPPTDIKEDPPK